MKGPSPANNNASAQSLKASSLVVCLCVGMSQLKLATSLMIPHQQQSSISISPPASMFTSCSSGTRLSMSTRGGNFQGRLGRYGGRLPEDMQQDDEQPALSWDWDEEDENNNNDMFGQPQSQQASNDGDTGELPNGDIEGATLSEDMKEKAKNSHLDSREESSQGGSKFRELMARASKQSATIAPRGQIYGAPPTQPQMQQPPQPVATTQVPPPSTNFGNPAFGGSSVSIPPNPMDLSIEEQAALFRQMMMEKQQQAQQQNPYSQEMAQFQKQQQQLERRMKDPYQTAPPRVYGPPPDLRNPYAQAPQYQASPPVQSQQQAPPPQQYQQAPMQLAYADSSAPSPPTGPPKDYREYGTGFDGRKIGRNKDAEAISNAADVYLAQLKRDSTSRNYARYAGDDEVANQVFHDPSIQKIYCPENPYRKEQRERERDLIETVPEEMLIFQDYSEVEEKQAAPRMSYKEKLEQFRNKQPGGQQ